MEPSGSRYLHSAEDWTFMNLVEDKSEKLVESRRVEYFDADGGHVSWSLKRILQMSMYVYFLGPPNRGFFILDWLPCNGITLQRFTTSWNSAPPSVTVSIWSDCHMIDNCFASRPDLTCENRAPPGEVLLMSNATHNQQPEPSPLFPMTFAQRLTSSNEDLECVAKAGGK